MKRKRNLITFLLTALSLIPFFVMSIYSRPCADDYSYSIATHRVIAESSRWRFGDLIRTAWDTNVNYIEKWNGLYISPFLDALQPGIYREQLYGLGAFILLLFGLIVSVLLVRTVVHCFFEKYEVNLTDTVLVGCALFSILLNGLPDTAEGIYWLNGAVAYSLFFFLTLMNVALILGFLSHEGRGNLGWIALSGILSFIIAGGNYLSGIMNLLLTIFFCCACWKAKGKLVLLSVLPALAGFILSLTAPGVSARAASYQRPGMLTALIKSTIIGYTLVTRWFNTQCIMLLIICIPIVMKLRRSDKVTKALSINPLIIIVVSVCILGAMIGFPVYASGSMGSARMTNLHWMTFIIFITSDWIYSLVWLSVKNDKINSIIQSLERLNWPCITIVSLFFCLFFGDANSITIAKEMASGRPMQYAVQCDMRYEMIRDAEKNAILEFDPLINCAPLRFEEGEITTDINDWRNKTWNEYYGVQVVLKEK